MDSFNTAMKKDLKYMKGKLEILGGYFEVEVITITKFYVQQRQTPV